METSEKKSTTEKATLVVEQSRLTSDERMEVGKVGF